MAYLLGRGGRTGLYIVVIPPCLQVTPTGKVLIEPITPAHERSADVMYSHSILPLLFRIVGYLPHGGVAASADRQVSDNAQGTRPRRWSLAVPRFPLWGFMRCVWTCGTGLGCLQVELGARFNTERPVLMLPKAIMRC